MQCSGWAFLNSPQKSLKVRCQHAVSSKRTPARSIWGASWSKTRTQSCMRKIGHHIFCTLYFGLLTATEIWVVSMGTGSSRSFRLIRETMLRVAFVLDCPALAIRYSKSNLFPRLVKRLKPSRETNKTKPCSYLLFASLVSCYPWCYFVFSGSYFKSFITKKIKLSIALSALGRSSSQSWQYALQTQPQREKQG